MGNGVAMKPGGKERPPRCTACQHYFITHDTSFPHGCRALDFKSWRLPMLDVLESSGQPCMYFQGKRREG